jgi:hypothetical protein
VEEEGRSGTPDTCCMYGDGNGVQGMVEGVGESSRQYFSIWLIMWASAIFSVRPPSHPTLESLSPAILLQGFLFASVAP